MRAISAFVALWTLSVFSVITAQNCSQGSFDVSASPSFSNDSDFASYNDTLCAACHSLCIDCFDFGSSDCFICFGVFVSSGAERDGREVVSCLDTCPDGYVADTDTNTTRCKLAPSLDSDSQELDQGGIAGLTIGLLIAFASFLGVLMSAVKIYSKFKERKQGEVDFEEYIDHGANDGTQPDHDMFSVRYTNAVAVEQDSVKEMQVVRHESLSATLSRRFSSQQSDKASSNSMGYVATNCSAVDKAEKDDYIKMGQVRPEDDYIKMGQVRPEDDYIKMGQVRPEDDYIKMGQVRPEDDYIKMGQERPEDDYIKMGQERPGDDYIKMGQVRPGDDYIKMGQVRPEDDYIKMGQVSMHDDEYMGKVKLEGCDTKTQHITMSTEGHIGPCSVASASIKSHGCEMMHEHTSWGRHERPVSALRHGSFSGEYASVGQSFGDGYERVKDRSSATTDSLYWYASTDKLLCSRTPTSDSTYSVIKPQAKHVYEKTPGLVDTCDEPHAYYNTGTL